MKAASQIVLCASSFVILLILGNFFDIAFWQARFHAEHLLSGKPLPTISEFFISHHHLPVHLFLLPWLAVVGAPLLRSRAVSYWDPQSFAFRYLAFLSTELLLFLVLLLALFLPFLPYYAVLEPPRESATELVVRVLFWLRTSLIVAMATYRTIKSRKAPNARPSATSNRCRYGF